jgi:hypothetical protein
MENIEDIFNDSRFKALPWKKRFWVRIKVAFFSFISYI